MQTFLRHYMELKKNHDKMFVKTLSATRNASARENTWSKVHQVHLEVPGLT